MRGLLEDIAERESGEEEKGVLEVRKKSYIRPTLDKKYAKGTNHKKGIIPVQALKQC